MQFLLTWVSLGFYAFYWMHLILRDGRERLGLPPSNLHRVFALTGPVFGCLILVQFVSTLQAGTYHPLLAVVSALFSVLGLAAFAAFIGVLMLFPAAEVVDDLCKGPLWEPNHLPRHSPLAVALLTFFGTFVVGSIAWASAVAFLQHRWNQTLDREAEPILAWPGAAQANNP